MACSCLSSLTVAIRVTALTRAQANIERGDLGSARRRLASLMSAVKSEAGGRRAPSL
jgi:hypothetical protein